MVPLKQHTTQAQSSSVPPNPVQRSEAEQEPGSMELIGHLSSKGLQTNVSSPSYTGGSPTTFTCPPPALVATVDGCNPHIYQPNPAPHGSQHPTPTEMATGPGPGQDSFGMGRINRWKQYTEGDLLTRRFRRHLVPNGPQEDIYAKLGIASNAQMKFKISKEKVKLELVFNGLGNHSLQRLHQLIFPPEGNNIPPSFTWFNADNVLEC